MASLYTLDSTLSTVYREGMKSIMIRAKLTDNEWLKIRRKALDSGTPTSKLVGDALRESLLKGAKP